MKRRRTEEELTAVIEKVVERIVARPDFATREAAAKAEKERLDREDAEAVGARMRARLAAAGIPKRDVDTIMQGRADEGMPAMKELRRWQSSADLTFLTLIGPAGTGKSFAAAVACSAVRESRFLRPAKFMRTSAYSEDVMAPIEEAALLVLDDIGQEFGDKSGFMLNRLDMLIAERAADGYKTIVTTNVPWADLRARLGARAADRLSGLGIVRELTGESMRRRRR